MKPVRRSMDVDAFDVPVRVVFDAVIPDELVLRAHEVWEEAIRPPDDRAPEVTLHTAQTHPEALLESLSVRVTTAALGHRKGDALMLHAAGIAADDGRVIALVGPSGRGKTTLVTALAAHYGYVSDETIAVEPSGTVAPYRKPLSRKRKGWPKEQLSPQSLGLRELPPAPLQLHRIVLLERVPGSGVPQLRAMSLSEALPMLLEQTSYLTELERPLSTVASLCERAGGVHVLRYEEAADVVPFVAPLLESEPQTVLWLSAYEAVDPVQGSATAATGGVTDPGDRLVPGETVLDAIEADGTVVVLTADGVVRVLGGVAPTLWRAAQRFESVTSATDLLTQEYGPPESGDAGSAVRAAVQQLVDVGVLSLRS